MEAERLTIQIRAEASAALTTINNLTGKIKTLGTQVKQVSTNLTAMTKGFTALSKTGNSLSALTSQTEKLGASLKQTSSEGASAMKSIAQIISIKEFKESTSTIENATSTIENATSKIENTTSKMTKGLENAAKTIEIISSKLDETSKATLKKFGEAASPAFSKAIAEAYNGVMNNLAERIAAQEITKQSKLKTAFGELTKKTKDYFSTLKKSIKESGGIVEYLAEKFKNLKNQSSKIFYLALAFGTLYKQILNCVDKTAQMADTIDDNAQKLNFSHSAYQEWSWILQLAGTDATILTAALKTLTNKMSACKEGTESAVEAFSALGISEEEVANSSREQMFSKVISSLQSVEDEVERAALAYQLFGKAGGEFIPLLSSSNQQLEYQRRLLYATGAVMSEDAIIAGNMYSDSLDTLRMALKGATNTIGQGFLPALTAIIQRITIVMAYVNAFIRAMFGLAQTTNSTEASSSKLGLTQRSLSNDFQNTTDSIEDATDAAKDFKRELMGFDEINILGDSGSSYSSGFASAAGSGIDTSDFQDFYDDLESYTPVFDEILSDEQLSKIEKFKKKMDEIRGWLGPMSAVCTTLIGIILVVLGACTLNLKMIIAGVAIAGLGIAIGFAKDENGDSNWKKFGNLFKQGSSSINAKVSGVISVIGSIVGVLMVIVGACTANVSLIVAGVALAGISIAVGQLKDAEGKTGWDRFGSLFTQGSSSINTKATGIITTISSIVGILMVIVGACTANIPLVIAGVALAGVGIAVGSLRDGEGKSFWSSLAEKFKSGATNISLSVSTAFDSLKSTLGNKWESIKTWFRASVQPKFTKESWGTYLGGIRKGAAASMSGTQQALSVGWTSIVNWFNSKAKSKFTKSYWSEKFSGIKKGMKDALNGVITFVETAVNVMVRKINKIGFTIPDWIPVYGGKRIGVSLQYVSIPRLAEGGIATKSTLANIGEAGKEAVLPLDRNTQWMDMLADKLALRVGAGNGETRFVAELNGKTLFEEVVNQNNSIVKTKGISPILV